MTTEPRQEAERIVFQVGSGRKQAQRFHESEDEFLRRRNALVDVLAAAIELHDARHGPDDGRGEIELENAEGRARLRLSEALSALREDET